MPWRIKRQLILVLLAFVMLAGAITIWVRHQNADVDILAVLAVVGGAAILVVSLPANGGGDRP
jgi:hypothetical protein